jgi:ADP-ribosylglycohydrolase
MLGAIAGDVIGSVYEHVPIKTTEFPLFQERSRFTDDTVMTVAVGYALVVGVGYAGAMKHFGRRYPHAGYGGSFRDWLRAPGSEPYNSWGNGAAMRVSPVGWACDSEADVLRAAEASAAATHNHPEGIRGAQATALAVFLARQGASKDDLRAAIEERFGYDLQPRLDDLRPDYTFDVSCQGTVPPALIAFLDTDSYETAVRGAISLGGDADTLAAIAGGVAEAYYGGVPAHIAAEVRRRLPADLLEVLDDFRARFVPAA